MFRGGGSSRPPAAKPRARFSPRSAKPTGLGPSDFVGRFCQRSPSSARARPWAGRSAALSRHLRSASKRRALWVAGAASSCLPAGRGVRARPRAAGSTGIRRSTGTLRPLRSAVSLRRSFCARLARHRPDAAPRHVCAALAPAFCALRPDAPAGAARRNAPFACRALADRALFWRRRRRSILPAPAVRATRQRTPAPRPAAGGRRNRRRRRWRAPVQAGRAAPGSAPHATRRPQARPAGTARKRAGSAC